jgi:hypothetical protein
VNEKHQNAHLKEVFSEPLTPRTTVALPSDVSGSGLSVSYESLINDYRITTETLRDIWEKASTLVNSQQSSQAG